MIEETTATAKRYRPLTLEIRAIPCGLTVTSLPGWLNITFAAVGEISLPNKQKRAPFRLSPLAHLANSSGEGV